MDSSTSVTTQLFCSHYTVHVYMYIHACTCTYNVYLISVHVYTVDSNNTCNNGDVRLFGGSTQYEGTVEVCLGGVWGSICYPGWGSNDAKVVCSQLGYAAHDNPAVFAAFFGPGTGPILLDNVNCEGTEDSITECLADPSPRRFCTHSFDAGVRCLQKCTSIITMLTQYMHVSIILSTVACVEDSLRLVDGLTSSEGRVEVCLNGIWSTVCDDGWNTPDAIVACRQLGYSDVGKDMIEREWVESGLWGGWGYVIRNY